MPASKILGVHTVSIQVVAEKTGLSPHAIRAWEKRYGAITPVRSAGRHRMYSQDDLYRLGLLADASRAGHQISRLSKLSNETLSALLPSRGAENGGGRSGRPETPSSNLADSLFLSEGFDAVLKLDTFSLDGVFRKAQVAMGDQGFLRRLIAPMAREIGERWRRGDLTAAQEHFFSAMARCFVWNLTRQYRFDERAPKIVVGTPMGQLHDLGAMMVAAASANNGWQVTFVGANLPAFELASAVQTVGACALALSICYPGDDPCLPLELEQLSAALPENVQVFVGGRASLDYLPALQKIGARALASLEDLDSELDAMRRKSRPNV